MSDKPCCFGIQPVQRGEGIQWDPSDTTCAGSKDSSGRPMRTISGDEIDPPCSFFSACGEDLRRNNLISADALTRRTIPQPISRQVPVTTLPQRGAQQQVQGYQTRTVAPAPQVRYVDQPTQQQWANFQPMAVNYKMPAYLTELEPDRLDNKWPSLFSEAARSIGKALGHSIAHFFDSVPLLPPRGR